MLTTKSRQFIKDFQVEPRNKINHRNVLFEALHQQAKLIQEHFTTYNAKGTCYILNNRSRYSNTKIVNYIKSVIGKRYVYILRVGKRQIKITFVDYDTTKNKKKEYDYYVKMVNMVLVLFSHGNKECSETLDIHVYMTHFKKKLPKHRQSVLSSVHINTGVSYRCIKHNQVAIYREEEWFKTLIHELQHAYGLDINVLFTLPKIHTHSELLTGEGYVEFFAEYLNCTICAYLNAKGDEVHFQQLFSLFSEAERRFSLIQANKVLWHMNMRYGGFFRKDNHYKERTNVFAYYFLNSYLWYDYDGFIQECLENNKNMFEVTDDKFIRKRIEGTYKNKEFIDELRENDVDYLDDSMRMAIIEYKKIEN